MSNVTKKFEIQVANTAIIGADTAQELGQIAKDQGIRFFTTREGLAMAEFPEGIIGTIVRN